MQSRTTTQIMENKNILITGGCGFIGSNFVKYLLNTHPYLLVNLDKLTYAGNPENLKDIEKNPNYKFVKGDICDREKTLKIIKENSIDTIIHFAAESHVDRSIEDSSPFIKTNVEGTLSLLECAKQTKIKKFIQISTDEVYGSTSFGQFTEYSPLNPSSPYSASKASADLVAKSYYITHLLPVIITRTSNNFGPYQYPEKAIPLFITNLMEGKKVPLYGKGLNVRDWIYVLDNCKAIDAVLHKGRAGEIYNISSQNEIKNIDLTKKILKEFNLDESHIQKVNDRPGHDFRYAITNDKIKTLGWKPEYDFETALKKTIDWYKNNTDWWKPLKEKQKEKDREKEKGDERGEKK